MMVDFSTALETFTGEVLMLTAPHKCTVCGHVDGGKEEPGTLGNVCLWALTTPLRDDKADGKEKFARGQLANKISREDSSGSVVTLTVEEVARLKDLIGRVFSAAVVFPAWTALENDSANSEKH